MQTLAVDWSGNRKGAREFLWLAEARDGHLKDLRNGLERDALVARLIALAEQEPRTVVGLDFAFSFPRSHRRTDREPEAPAAKSVFQVGGAGAVGTGSIRGMPHLLTLAEHGFSVWPFDPPGWPLLIEMYPRALTGPVTKNGHEVEALEQASSADYAIEGRIWRPSTA